MKNGKRDTSYDLAYQKTPKAKAKAKVRMADRYQAKKEGRVKVGDGRDIHHVGGARKGAKTKVMPASKNRSIK